MLVATVEADFGWVVSHDASVQIDILTGLKAGDSYGAQAWH